MATVASRADGFAVRTLDFVALDLGADSLEHAVADMGYVVSFPKAMLSRGDSPIRRDIVAIRAETALARPGCLGHYIRALALDRLDLSVTLAAEAIGFIRAAFSAFLNGRASPSSCTYSAIVILPKLARAKARSWCLAISPGRNKPQPRLL